MSNLRQIIHELNILWMPVDKCDCEIPVEGEVSELRLTYICATCKRPIPLEWAGNYKWKF